MSTTAVSAGQVMDRVANLLNDPNKTDYTYVVQIPYLNMAIEEFSDLMVEANSPHGNFTSTNFYAPPVVIPVGDFFMAPVSAASPPGVVWPRYPDDLIEIQELSERRLGETGPFRRLSRVEFEPQLFPITDSLLFWYWESGVIRFNRPGATVPIEVQLKFLYQGVPYVTGPETIITMIGARTYLAYKTAAFCAMFIGENETRAAVLEDQAEKAAERSLNISSKGRQQIVTRHRPFRAAWKARSGF